MIRQSRKAVSLIREVDKRANTRSQILEQGVTVAKKRVPKNGSLLDRLNPTIAEVTQAVEQEVEKCPEARPLRTHPLVGFRCGKQIASYQGLGPSEVQVVP
jgi:hypothetical protein